MKNVEVKRRKTDRYTRTEEAACNVVYKTEEIHM